MNVEEIQECVDEMTGGNTERWMEYIQWACFGISALIVSWGDRRILAGCLLAYFVHFILTIIGVAILGHIAINRSKS
jgi:hypothetical protein